MIFYDYKLKNIFKLIYELNFMVSLVILWNRFMQQYLYFLTKYNEQVRV